MNETIQVVNARETITDVYPIVSEALNALSKARTAFGKAVLKTSEIKSHYSSAITIAFGAMWWEAKGEIKKMVKAEHTAYIDMCLNELGWTRSNADKVWSEIKDLSGRVKAPRVQGDISIDARNATDLVTILNRIENSSPNEAPMSHAVKNALIEIAESLDIDTDKYKLTQE